MTIQSKVEAEEKARLICKAKEQNFNYWRDKRNLSRVANGLEPRHSPLNVNMSSEV